MTGNIQKMCAYLLDIKLEDTKKVGPQTSLHYAKLLFLQTF